MQQRTCKARAAQSPAWGSLRSRMPVSS
jgi:hypothetical protein